MSISFRDLVFGNNNHNNNNNTDKNNELLEQGGTWGIDDNQPSPSKNNKNISYKKNDNNDDNANKNNYSAATQKRKRNEGDDTIHRQHEPQTKTAAMMRRRIPEGNDRSDDSMEDDSVTSRFSLPDYSSDGESISNLNNKNNTQGGVGVAVDIERVKKIATQRLEALYRSADRVQQPAMQNSRTGQDPILPESSLSSTTANAVHPMVLQNAHILPSQLPHYRVLKQQTKRKKKKRKNRRRLRRDDGANDSSSDDDDNEDGESQYRTAEQIEIETAMQERKRIQALREREWRTIRRRWRKRRSDVRQEPDVGGAIRAAMYHSQQQEQKQKKQKRSHSATDEEKDVQNYENFPTVVQENHVERESAQVTVHDTEEMNEAQEEPQDFFNRLLQTSQELEGMGKDMENKSVETNWVPYKDRLDYWELGYTFPKRTHTSLYRPAALPIYDGRHLHPLAPTTQHYRHEHQGLVPRNQIPRNTILQHKRQIMRLVARCIFTTPQSSRRGGGRGTAKKKLILTNRMLRLLWNPSMLEATSFSMVDRQAKWCGRRIVKLLGHNVQDDTTVAIEALEIDRDIGMLGTTIPESEKVSAQVTFFPRRETHMRASSNYVAVPGTEPPPPQHPMISVGFEFGPTDKFNFIWHTEKVPEETVRISLSTLFAQWLSTDDEDGQRAELENQMSTMMEHVVRLNTIKLQALLRFRKDPVDELPTLRLYQSLMTFCSLTASNGGRSLASIVGSEVERGTGMQPVTSQLFHFLEQSAKIQGLNSFPRIHLIYALLRIASELPEEAIGILAGALGGKSLATPFTIIRQLIEYLENEGLLLERSSADGYGIEVGKLEYLFFQASESVLKCIEADPIEPEHHSWYIAIKAGSLMLCSGNRIGANARVYPSYKKKMSTDDVLFDMVEGKKLDHHDHELRPKLNKFEEIRIEIARAFKLLLKLTRLQDSARCHSAVSSFLEWGQVVALLVGDSQQKESYFTEIRRMHEWHCYQWAIREQSKITVEYLKRIEGSQQVLSNLADCLEKYPEEVVNWRRLVRALGAIPAQKEKMINQTSAKTEKSSSLISAKPFSVDSEEMCDDKVCSETLRHDAKVSHWHSSRESWWLTDFLYVPIPDFLKNQPWTLKGNLDALRRQAVSDLEKNVSMEKCGVFFGMVENCLSPKDDSVGWLEACLVRTNSDAEVPPEERSKQYDHLLPVPISESMKEPPDVNYDHLGRPFPSLEKVGPKMEVTCYRLFIRCYVNSLADPLVAKAIRFYLYTAWDDANSTLDTNHESWRALAWMHSMGIDILIELPEKPWLTKGESAYPPEMTKLVIEHVARFGPRQWSSLQRTYPSIFNNRHTVKNCYLYLLRTGLVESKGPPLTKSDIAFTPEMRKLVKEHVAMFGPRQWNILQKKHPSIFHNRSKVTSCYHSLSKRGLNESVGQSVTKNDRSVAFPPEMRKLVMEHVATFGPRQWHLLRKKYPSIFHNSVKASNCYVFLLKNGFIHADKSDA